MNVPVVLARTLMRATGWLVPRERSEWLAAMLGEFGELTTSRAALSWAGGCLVAATGWRVRAELPYLATVALACAASTAGYLAWWWLTPPSVDLSAVTFAQQAAIVCATLSVGLIFPRRAVASALLIVMTSGFGGMPLFVADVLGSAGTLERAVALVPAMARFVAENSWPALLTALGAWGWAKARPARGSIPPYSPSSSS